VVSLLLLLLLLVSRLGRNAWPAQQLTLHSSRENRPESGMYEARTVSVRHETMAIDDVEDATTN
jgi:hypothetical protein